ncbi:MAG: short chain dehydrogenase [Euryarchaeota archaeon]|nr:short chain dehydrogenase [Euryarchaeota archaeon]
MNLELAVFYLLAIVTLVSAVLVITTKDIFRAAISLMLMFVAIAAVYLTLGAEFLAMVQILVYAGAVTILIIFGIMLTKKENSGGDG